MPQPTTEQLRLDAVLVDALLVYVHAQPRANQAALLRWLDDMAERITREDGVAWNWLEEARQGLGNDDVRKAERDEFLARTAMDGLPPGLPPEEYRAAVRLRLDALAAPYAQFGFEPPAWLAAARHLHLNE